MPESSIDSKTERANPKYEIVGSQKCVGREATTSAEIEMIQAAGSLEAEHRRNGID